MRNASLLQHHATSQLHPTHCASPSIAVDRDGQTQRPVRDRSLPHVRDLSSPVIVGGGDGSELDGDDMAGHGQRIRVRGITRS